MKIKKKFDKYIKVMEDNKPVETITCEEAKTVFQRITNQDLNISEKEIIKFTEHIRQCKKCQ